MFLVLLTAIFPIIQTPEELANWLPITEEAIEQQKQSLVQSFNKELTDLLSIEDEERTFKNTIRRLDLMEGSLKASRFRFGGLCLIHPDASFRETAAKAAEDLNRTFLDALAKHPEIYNACLAVEAAAKPLKEHEAYYLQELLSKFQRLGMQLPAQERELFLSLQQEILEIWKLLDRNIQADQSELFVSKDKLSGMEEQWIAELPQNEQGEFRLGCDYPTYTAILTRCTHKETRRDLYDLFVNRAYPSNVEVLRQLIAKRDEMAHLLGFTSYAAYELAAEMVGSVETAERFIETLYKSARVQAALEFQEVTRELPEGIELTSSGKLAGSDSGFVYEKYRKQHFALDPKEIAEYFPMEKTIQGLMRIYEQFFGLSIREISHTIPLPDLRVLEVRDQGQKLLGFILMDLFPREGKYSHACCESLLPPLSLEDGDHPAVTILVTNFTKPTKGTPSLMMHYEVLTFFHEFGHAIHNTLGKADLSSWAGFQSKIDFVELPSQLLEEWLFDPEILTLISSHYLTGEPLSQKQIQSIIRSEQFGGGAFVQRQCSLATLALACFKEGQDKDPIALSQQILSSMQPQAAFKENNHWVCSFGHLGEYAARYYGYLWSEVFALDVFEKIRSQGLLNPKAGAAYANCILKPAGSRDPNQMLVDFLGREPSQDAFFKKMFSSDVAQ